MLNSSASTRTLGSWFAGRWDLEALESLSAPLWQKWEVLGKRVIWAHNFKELSGSFRELSGTDKVSEVMPWMLLQAQQTSKQKEKDQNQDPFKGPHPAIHFQKVPGPHRIAPPAAEQAFKVWPVGNVTIQATALTKLRATNTHTACMPALEVAKSQVSSPWL